MSEQIVDIKGEIMESGPDPIVGSGLKLTNANKDTNTTQTVVPGATYVFTALSIGAFYFGLATMATAANVNWVCGQNSSIYLKIPLGYTTLHYATDVDNGVGYLRRIR